MDARYLYLAHDGDACKVGVSADPARRVARLSALYRRRLVLAGTVPTMAWRKVERAVHDHLAPTRTHATRLREWFTLDAPGRLIALAVMRVLAVDSDAAGLALASRPAPVALPPRPLDPATSYRLVHKDAPGEHVTFAGQTVRGGSAADCLRAASHASGIPVGELGQRGFYAVPFRLRGRRSASAALASPSAA